VIERLHAGQRVACVSDAGTPAVSDPGARLAAAAAPPRAAAARRQQRDLRLSAAGLAGDGTFVFEGFLPSKSGERAAAVQALAQQTRAVVLLEAPHRIAALADALAALGQRPSPWHAS
jgi:16S rRNA (cytidine1402-2'-O)-methyltransferase